MAQDGSSTATAVAIAVGTVVGLFLLSRFSGPGAGGGTGGGAGGGSTGVPPVPPGTILPPITAENLGYDLGILLKRLVDSGPEFVDGLLKGAGAGTLIAAGAGVYAWYYKGQLIGYFVRGTTAAAVWTFKQVIRFVRGGGGGGGTPPPAGGAPAPVAPPATQPAPAPATAPATSPSVSPSASVIQDTITRIRHALESGVAPVTRDVQNLISWVTSGVVPKTAVLAALGATAVTAIFRLAPSVASLASLAAALA